MQTGKLQCEQGGRDRTDQKCGENFLPVGLRNAVAPGFIDTEMTAQMTDKAKEAVKTQIPLGRVGKVDDIAEVVTFLASEKASYITGQVISVDGGMSI